MTTAEGPGSLDVERSRHAHVVGGDVRAATARLAGRLLALLVLATTVGSPSHGLAQDEPAPLPAEEPAGGEDVEDEEADADDPEVEARERFLTGLALARAGNCDGAVSEFFASLALAPRPNTLYNIARCYEELFRYDLAVSSYQRYLELAAEDEPDRAAVEATLRSLSALLGTIVVASNVPAEVWVGDRVVGTAPGEVLVPGGRHALELRANGWLPLRREVEVAGRQRVEVSLELERAEVTITNVDQRTIVENRTVQVTERAGAPPALFWTGVALTAAGVAATAALGGWALSLRGDAQGLSSYDRDAVLAANERTRRAARMSDIALAITGGLAAITVLLFFLTRFDDDEPAGTTAALRVRPASLDLEVRF